jgi:signal transduction histidine kinase
VPVAQRAQHLAGMARVRATGRSELAGQRIELPAVDRSGRTFPVDFSLQVTEVLGKPVFHAFLHDVSARRQAEAELHRINGELERANVLKLDLMGMLSHDIGTPLSTIIGHSDLMLAQELPSQATAPLSKIHRAARRIDQLRHNVLSMCRLDADTIIPDRQPVALAGVLREALDAAGADLPVDCPEGLHVLADPAHVQQIIVNLLTNAAKYGGGATAVSVRSEGGAVVIGVHDEGAGVPAGLRDRLFGRFTRADDVSAAGHGLGLHIVASLAEANGGTVAHRDNDPAGSVFTLTLATARP